MAAQSRGSVKVLVQPENGSLEAMAIADRSSRWVRRPAIDGGWRVSRGYCRNPGVVVGGSSQVFLAGPYMILYRVDRGRPAALLGDLRPSPGELARRGPEMNSTPIASPGTVRSCSHCREPMRSACGGPGSSHAESRFRQWHAVSVRSCSSAVAVRDSKNPSGSRLVLASEEWRRFTARVRAGRFG